MTVRYQTATVYGACGVGAIYGFHSRPSGFGHSLEGPNPYLPGGAGWVSFGLINTKDCKEVFNFMKAKYKIVFLAEKRINNNSGNSFSFVIFDKKTPVSETVNNDAYKFPWARTTRES